MSAAAFRRRWPAWGLALLLLATVGCAQRKVEAVRNWKPAVAAEPLAAQAGRLLEAPRWGSFRDDSGFFVTVSGTLRAEPGIPVEIVYGADTLPPAVAWFSLAGKRRPAGEYPGFLRRQLLLRALERR
ncbi:MAG: hypothetical protein WC789_05525 [Lentisphaeria bacterium]|jgi:hypothetical protein